MFESTPLITVKFTKRISFLGTY